MKRREFMKRAVTGVAALLALLLLVPASPARAAQLFYDNTAIRLPKISKKKADLYRRAVAASLVRGRIRSVSEATNESGSKSRKIAGKGDGSSKLKKLPLAGVAAVAYTGAPRFWGSELDMLVRVEDRLVPVTLWYGKRGDVVVAVGEARSSRPRLGRDLPDTAGDIARRYGTGPIRGRGKAWKERELKILAGALELLSGKERRVLDDVRFVRSAAGPRGPMNAGRYFWGTGGYRLAIYDRAFSLDSRAFCGRASKPRPFSAATILHEVGHAIAAWPGRRALERDKVSQAKRLGGPSGPVLKAYRRQAGGKRGPTRYGRRSVEESFAESFALHKLDPAGLKRWSPEVYSWFKEGGHLKAWE